MAEPAPQDPAPKRADATPYDLEPPAPPPALAPGTLAKEGVLAGFDEDDDFDRDPEVEKALKGGKPPKKAPEPSAPLPDAFVKPGLGNAQIWGVVGGFLLVGAVVAAAMTSQKKFAMALLVLYSGLVHVGTGLVAVYLTARLDSKRVGEIELAAGRMLTAVGAFLLILNLNITIYGHTKTEELLLASTAYLAALAGLFRIWGRTLAILTTIHFTLWAIFELGMALSTWATAVAVVPPGAAR